MYPILGRYGPFFFYSYTAALGLGLLLGLALVRWQVARPAITAPPIAAGAWLEGVLASLLAGLVGGRLLFVAANLDYFRLHPAAAWEIWRGGVAYHGALVAALLALALYYRRHFWQHAALLAPAAALWSAWGWLACWLEGCAYGRETILRGQPLLDLFAADLPDVYGVHALRYQAQAVGLVLTLLSFALLWRWRTRLAPAALALLALFLLSASHFTAGLLRGDEVLVIAGLRLGLVVDAALAVGALVLLLVLGPRSPQRSAWAEIQGQLAEDPARTKHGNDDT